ncbi:MAG: NAD(P)/FAD-dependent oxidoreductase [Flavipsychrobacter sp.]|nr:NAD(P)/FAD-dependent oxidoreductase [Flavipsychrobacter sp.]
MLPEYDIVIVGSGLGGLLCGAILGKEGYKVCVLEKNRQYGGSLQTFSRDKTLFDSGVHYIGGLAPGQTLYQVFSYLGLTESLKLHQLDRDGFDRIVFLEDGTEYAMAQGYDQFTSKLKQAFPEEGSAIDQYCSTIREICSKFPMYNLRTGDGMKEKEGVMGIDTHAFLQSITTNQRLQEVLAGNNFLYAGEPDKTPLYVHALVVNSYIESAWKILDGGSQITKHLVKLIRSTGGDLFNHTEVVKLEGDDERLTRAVTKEGNQFMAKYFISNLHPKRTLEITASPLLKAAYRNRIIRLADTVSSFSLNAVLKPGVVPYLNHNYYLHQPAAVWKAVEAHPNDWPLSAGVFFTEDANHPGYAESVSILTYISAKEWEPWKESFNTDSQKGERGDDYHRLKTEKAELLLGLVEKRFPGLREAIRSYSCATPLSFRDYIGTDDGSLYGIAKDYRNPMATYLPTRTKVPNLFLTGQNVLLHGILGVTITALTTCAEFVPVEELLKKIRSAK